MYSSDGPVSDIQTISQLDAYPPSDSWLHQSAPTGAGYSNQWDGGIPLDTVSDAGYRAYDPLPETLSFGVPNLGAPGRGLTLLYPYTETGNGLIDRVWHLTDWLAFSNPSRLIVYVDSMNYQGVAPMEVQPLLDAPEPWTIYTPQQRAGGG